MGPARVTDKSAVAWEKAGLAARVQNKAIAPAKLRAVRLKVLMKLFSFSKCVSLPKSTQARTNRSLLFPGTSPAAESRGQSAQRHTGRQARSFRVKVATIFESTDLYARDVSCLVTAAVLFAELLEGECRSESTPVARPSYLKGSFGESWSYSKGGQNLAKGVADAVES